MIARIHGLKGAEYTKGMEQMQKSSYPAKDQLRVNYYGSCNERDPYPDPSLLEQIDGSKK